MKTNSLTKKEKQILTYIAHGYTNREMAEFTTLSPRTIEGIRAGITQKLNVSNTFQAIAFCISNGIIKY